MLAEALQTNKPARRAMATRRACARHGSPSWIRTSDILINSQTLYQLSYRGTPAAVAA
jgi:hypothetical protein